MSRRQPTRDRAGARVVLVMLVVLTMLLGGGYVAAFAGAQDKTPRGTRVAGINVGGRTVAAAANALRDGLSTRANAAITVVVGSGTGGGAGQRQDVLPSDAGLGVDYVASVQHAGAGRSWDPDWLWNYYTGGPQLQPVKTVSQMQMNDYLMRLAASVGTTAQDGAVSFEGQRVTVTKPRTGLAIDPQQAQAALVAAFLSDDPTARISLVQTAPDIDDADVRKAVQRLANPAMSGPVTLDFGQSAAQQVHLEPRDYAAALSMRPVDGALRLHVDANALMRLVRQVLGDRARPVDAMVQLIGGRPRVIPDRPGVSFRAPEVLAAFTAALTQPAGSREAAVSAQPRPASFTTQDARHLHIRHRVGSFTTTYSAAEADDVTRAAAALDGALLMPGDTFSFAAVAGTAYGTGVLPATTALFNAAYDAGFGDVEHHAPATYAGHSPVGRQATVGDGGDLRFSVDAPSGVLVNAHASGGTVTVTLWSTAAWEVTVSTSARYDVVPPATTSGTGADCVPSPGRNGFSVDVTRHLHNLADPTSDRDETLTTVYAPVDGVTCTP